MSYTTRELTKEEGDALTKDLQAVLEKHNAELGIKSVVELLRRVEDPVLSPLNDELNLKAQEKTDTAPDQSSSSDSGESA